MAQRAALVSLLTFLVLAAQANPPLASFAKATLPASSPQHAHPGAPASRVAAQDADSLPSRLVSARTGDAWDPTARAGNRLRRGLNARPNMVHLTFEDDLAASGDGAGTGLDPATVEPSDFTVDGQVPLAVQVIDLPNESLDPPQRLRPLNVFLTLPAAMASDARPTVALVGQVSDLASNATAAGQVVADDGLGPQLSLSLDRALAGQQAVLTITANEPLAAPPTVTLGELTDPATGAVTNGPPRAAQQTGPSTYELVITGDLLNQGTNPGNSQRVNVLADATDAAANPGRAGKTTAVEGALTLEFDTRLNGGLGMAPGTTPALVTVNGQAVDAGANPELEYARPLRVTINWAAEGGEYPGDTHGKVALTDLAVGWTPLGGGMQAVEAAPTTQDGIVYLLTFPDPAPGEYSVQFSGKDEANNVSVSGAAQPDRFSRTFTLVDRNAPVIATLWPYEGFTNSGARVVLTGDVTDAHFGLSRLLSGGTPADLKVVVDGREYGPGSLMLTALETGWHFVLPLSLATGPHTWQVIAQDWAANQVVSPLRNLAVEATPPAPTPTPTPLVVPAAQVTPAPSLAGSMAQVTVAQPTGPTRLASADGTVELRFPPGALSATAQLALTPLAASQVPPAPSGLSIVRAFRLEVFDTQGRTLEGVLFLQPATISFRLSQQELGLAVAQPGRLVVQVHFQGQWAPAQHTLRRAEGAVEVQTARFSTWSFAFRDLTPAETAQLGLEQQTEPTATPLPTATATHTPTPTVTPTPIPTPPPSTPTAAVSPLPTSTPMPPTATPTSTAEGPPRPSPSPTLAPTTPPTSPTPTAPLLTATSVPAALAPSATAAEAPAAAPSPTPARSAGCGPSARADLATALAGTALLGFAAWRRWAG
ncbi:MAG: hypothetical protein HY683_06930 [Chloroflexi bacterium]|nr:hypothetical protein [Chloroflexota bacterium]